jgi:hypothetical protein
VVVKEHYKPKEIDQLNNLIMLIMTVKANIKKGLLVKGILLIILILSVISIVIFSNIKLTDYQFKKKISLLSINPSPQVWAHARNSMVSFEQAIVDGAKGIEIDVHYDSSLFKFVISHDHPYQTHNGNLLFLEELLEKIPFKGYYWIDLKNLSKENLEDVTKKFKYLIKKYQKHDNLFVESWVKREISKLSNNGIQTIYWIDVKHPPGSFDHLREMHIARELIVNSNFYAISGPYEVFQQYRSDIFSSFPLFVFTVNDRKVLEEFKSNIRVKVILTDKPSFYNL